METSKFKATWVFDVTLGDLRAGVPYIWHEGGTRSGKTHNIVAACLLHVAKTGQSLDVVRAANTTLKGTILEEDLLPLAKRLGLYDEARHNKSEQLFYVGQGRVRYYGVDEGQKVKGKKRDILLMNEANEIDSAKRRQLWMRTTGTIIIDHNPTVDDEHWIVKLLDPKVASGECHYYHSTYLDNPFLPKQQVRNIESMQHDDPYGWTVYGLGLRGSNPAAVFTDVRLGSFDPQLDTVYGTDFGFKNPFVVCEWGWRDSDPPERPRAILYCRPLVYATHLTTGDAIDQLKEKKADKRKMMWCESAEGDRILELRRAGYKARPVKKSSSTAKTYRHATYDWMKRHTIIVDNTAENADIVKSELRRVRHKLKPGSTDIYTDDVVDADDHVADTGRYGAFSRYAPTLRRTVRGGGVVRTR